MNNQNNAINNLPVVNNADPQLAIEAMILRDDLEVFVEHVKDIKLQEATRETVSRTDESFPWFFDRDNNPIDWTDSIRVFDGVKLVQDYLHNKRGENV